MSRIITYTSSFDPSPLVACLPAAEGIAVHSLHDLAMHLVGELDVRVVIVQDGMAEELDGFLSALKRSFHRLDVVIVTRDEGRRLPQGILRLDGRMDPRELCAVFRGVCGIIAREQRGKARFDWPLTGQVSLDGETWTSLTVRSLSASGAFLEHGGVVADPGAVAELRLEFQDSSLRTTCEILDARPPSAGLPQGFGVRFLGMPAPAIRAIDDLVKDALLAALLEPDSAPAVPAFRTGESPSGVP
jgi:hypothetical protein